MRTAVVIASAGRPALLAKVVSNLDGQNNLSFDAVVAVPDTDSLPREGLSSRWTVVTGARGLTAQRNRALNSLEYLGIVFFFDDDSVVREDYIATALEFFRAHPEVVGLTGRVLLDGATTGEIPEDDAARALHDSWAQERTHRWRPSRELYGCNFAVRFAAAPDMRFDERLPLYSWLEDHDLARRLMRVGQLAQVDDCVIVHRGSASGGRQAHLRFGYSQMMNPIYLWRKGSFPLWLMMYQAGRNVARNIQRSIAGREHEWRRQRLRGNVLAAADVLRGRITPERITSL